MRMDKCSNSPGRESSRSSSNSVRAKNRNIVRDLFKESSLSSDDTEFMELPLPPLPKTVEDLALNRRSVVDVENLDVHPCVAAFLMSRMEYYIGAPSLVIFPFLSPEHLHYIGWPCKYYGLHSLKDILSPTCLCRLDKLFGGQPHLICQVVGDSVGNQNNVRNVNQMALCLVVLLLADIILEYSHSSDTPSPLMLGGSVADRANSLLVCFIIIFTLLDDDGSDAAVLIKGGGDTTNGTVDDDNDDVDRVVGRNCDEALKHGSTSSLEDEVDSTSSRDVHDFSTEREQSLDNRDGCRDYYERPSDNSSDGEDGDEDERTPQYRHSVTTNWSSSDEETDKYKDRSSLFRRSQTTASSPDYFQPPSRGDLINLLFKLLVLCVHCVPGRRYQGTMDGVARRMVFIVRYC